MTERTWKSFLVGCLHNLRYILLIFHVILSNGQQFRWIFYFFCWLKVSSWVDEMWSSWMVLRWILYISYNNEIVPSLCWGFQWSIRLFFSYEVWIFDYLSFELWLQLENFFRRWFNLNSLSLFGKSMRLQFYSDLRKDFSIYIFLMKALQLKITELCFISSRKK